jgi:hypothetical protein
VNAEFSDDDFRDAGAEILSDASAVMNKVAAPGNDSRMVSDILRSNVVNIKKLRIFRDRIEIDIIDYNSVLLQHVYDLACRICYIE